MTLSRSVLLRDLLLALAAVLGSLAILPGVIYLVGLKLFGTYSGGVHQLYLDTFASLAAPTWPAWILTLGPALGLLALRWIWRRQPGNGPSTAQGARQEPTL